MMYNYPFFSFPNFRNYRPQNITPNNHMQHFNYEQINNKQYLSTLSEPPKENAKYKKRYNKKEDKIAVKANFSGNNNNNNNYNNSNNYNNAKIIKNENDALFEIFGIKLYFDDILLISLIFFLYSEGVKDDYLFISLILLLIS